MLYDLGNVYDCDYFGQLGNLLHIREISQIKTELLGNIKIQDLKFVQVMLYERNKFPLMVFLNY